jgi:hypothetical protein
MANVISSYTPAGTRKGTKMRKSEKQASASLRAKAKGRKTATKKSAIGKVAGTAQRIIKDIERPFPAQVLGGTYTYEKTKKSKKK